jgi:sulfur carrier protein
VKLRINGEARELPDGLTISTLLSHLGIVAGAVAVEVNAEVVRRPLHPERRLADGDEVEIVTFVGGG